MDFKEITPKRWRKSALRRLLSGWKRATTDDACRRLIAPAWQRQSRRAWHGGGVLGGGDRLPAGRPDRLQGADQGGRKSVRRARSLIFKSLQVVRFFDAKRNVLVYVAYSDRVMTGSPQNSISTVPLAPWGTAAAKTL
jgi:CreA protein